MQDKEAFLNFSFVAAAQDYDVQQIKYAAWEIPL